MKCLDSIQCFSFCFCCTLQSGVISSVVIFTTILISMITLVFYVLTILEGWDGSTMSPVCIATSHAVFVLLGMFCAFWGAFSERRSCMLWASLLLLLGFLVYFLASVLSYIPKLYTYTCVANRCPDLLWLQDSYWRAYYFYRKNKLLNVQLEDEDYMEDQLNTFQLEILKNDQKNGSHLGTPMSHKRGSDGQKELRKSYDSETKFLYSEQSSPSSIRKNLPELTVYFNVTNVTDEDFTRMKIRLPLLGLALSVTFNVMYLVFLLYVIIIYVAYGNEIRNEIPAGLTADDWRSIQGKY